MNGGLNWGTNWSLAALCAILVAPMALVDVPPLLDYPNHLARAVVLTFGGDDPVLSRMYAAHWAIIPNLGTDLVLPPLLHVLPIHLAGRVVVGCAILLPVIGTIAYSRATFGTRSVWPLASGLVAYNATLLLGFVNFVAAIGIALLLAAAWITWRDRAPRRAVAVGIAGTVALFFCHLMGLVFFYALIAGYELAWICAHRTERPAILARLAALVPLVAVPLGLYLLSPLALLPADTEFPSLADKARHLAFPFVNYVLPLDVATACAVGAFLLACVAKGRCRITPGSGLALLVIAGLYLATPSAFKGTFFFDIRFVIMLGFLLFGAVLPTGLPHAAAFAAGTVFTLLFAVRMAVVALAWHGHRHNVADMRAVIATVAPGARVFVASVSPEETPDYWRNGPPSRRLSNGIRTDEHLPALLLIERRAYWPFLFDNPSQQPVETLSPYRDLAARAGSMPDHGALVVPGKVDLCGYDYLLLLEAGAEPDLPHFATDRLALVARSDIAALFRVRPSACAS
jgi:hypothetical protein